MQPKARMNEPIPTPPERLRPRYAPRAAQPTVRATSPMTCPNSARVTSRPPNWPRVTIGSCRSLLLIVISSTEVIIVGVGATVGLGGDVGLDSEPMSEISPAIYRAGSGEPVVLLHG